MRTKRLLIAGLCALNALLFAVLIFMTTDVPKAYAQRGGGGAYTAVTAEYQEGTDALWLLKASSGELAVLVPNQQNGSLRGIGKRDIKGDL